MPLSTKPTRRSLLAGIPVIAAAVAPGAVTALGGLPAQPADDPIFAAIAAVKEARQIYEFAFAEQRKVEDAVPKDIDGHFFGGKIRFAAGCFNGQPMYVSSEDELNELIVKRFMALLVDRGAVTDGKIDGVLAERPEAAWCEIEVKQVFKDWNEMMKTRERGRLWREQSGHDRVKEACENADEALAEAERALVHTVPTTAAGLIALLAYFEEDGLPYGVDDWQDAVLPTLAEVARKVLTV